jgi:hypothetical protein
MQGRLQNVAPTSVSWTVYLEDGTTLAGTLPHLGNDVTIVPPSGAPESWNNVTWVAFRTNGGTVWMAGPASGINVPAVLVAAGPGATLAHVTNALGTPAASSLALLVNLTDDRASWILYIGSTPQSGMFLPGNVMVPVPWTGVTWIVFDSDAGRQYMAGPASGSQYAAELIAVTNSTTIDDVLALTADLPR